MASNDQTHESLDRPEEVKQASDRSVGVVFTVVFALVAAWPLKDGGEPRLWAAGLAAALLALALAWPRGLHPLAVVWLGFGALLHRIVSPIMLGVMFFGVFMPMGLAMRLAGKDPLRLKREPDSASYWIARTPPGPAPESMTKQF